MTVIMHVVKPLSPVVGDSYYDPTRCSSFVYTGSAWVEFSYTTEKLYQPKNYTPTSEQLEKHPSLKQAWDEYLVLYKLLGL
jgi:hypothetical protein